MWSQRDTGLIAPATCSSRHKHPFRNKTGQISLSRFLTLGGFSSCVFLLMFYFLRRPCVFLYEMLCAAPQGHHTAAPQLKTEEQTNESSPQHTRLPCKSAPKDTITTSWKHWNTRTVIFFYCGGRMKDRNWRSGEPGLVRNAWALGGLNQLH